MRTKRILHATPVITKIFNDQNQEVGRVYHHRKNDFGLHLNGWYWRDGKPNQQSGSSGACFPSLKAAIAVAQDLLKMPPDESMHVGAVHAFTLDDFIKQLQAVRATVPGNTIVAFRDTSFHGHISGLSQAIAPKMVEAKPHYRGFVTVDGLYEGASKRFEEPYQSQIEARPSVPVVVLW